MNLLLSLAFLIKIDDDFAFSDNYPTLQST